MGSPKTTTQSSPPFVRPLITLDTTVSHFLHTLFKPILPTFLLLLLEYSADFRFSFPVSLSLILASPSLSSPSTPLILGLLLDLAIIGLIKLTFRRARPSYNPNMSPVVHADNFSFPSGHASRVLFLATLFHLILQNDDGFVSDFIKRWIKLEAGFVLLGVWVWAIMTATSRVLLGRHFLFDVLAGVIIGVLEGIFAFLVFGFRKHSQSLGRNVSTDPKRSREVENCLLQILRNVREASSTCVSKISLKDNHMVHTCLRQTSDPVK